MMAFAAPKVILLAKRGSTSPCIPSPEAEGKNSGLQNPQTFAGLGIAGRRDIFIFYSSWLEECGLQLRSFLLCDRHKPSDGCATPSDGPTMYADATALERDFGFTPKITLREGLRKFAEWYKSYYCSDV
jgi:hypothetical protein